MHRSLVCFCKFKSYVQIFEQNAHIFKQNNRNFEKNVHNFEQEVHNIERKTRIFEIMFIFSNKMFMISKGTIDDRGNYHNSKTLKSSSLTPVLN